MKMARHAWTPADFRRGPQDRDRRGSLGDRGVPAREAGQGLGLRADPHQEPHQRADDRQDVQVRRPGGQARHRGEGDAVPLPRGRPLQLHGQQVLRADVRPRGADGGREANFIKDNTTTHILFFNGKAIGVTLPNAMDLRVAKCDPGVRGRHRLGRHQARHPGDRLPGERAALHQRGRAPPHRHPHRRVPHPRRPASRRPPPSTRRRPNMASKNPTKKPGDRRAAPSPSRTSRTSVKV
ncbi:MAG: hypothetical protein MZV64_14740 [Ignavibacteriales bacterium]|nr:hypothetical protein [Ignavibacteriales bacterium]